MGKINDESRFLGSGHQDHSKLDGSNSDVVPLKRIRDSDLEHEVSAFIDNLQKWKDSSQSSAMYVGRGNKPSNI